MQTAPTIAADGEGRSFADLRNELPDEVARVATVHGRVAVEGPPVSPLGHGIGVAARLTRLGPGAGVGYRIAGERHGERYAAGEHCISNCTHVIPPESVVAEQINAPDYHLSLVFSDSSPWLRRLGNHGAVSAPLFRYSRCDEFPWRTPSTQVTRKPGGMS